jgi:DNA-binding transcriptional ArsR family regulator
VQRAGRVGGRRAGTGALGLRLATTELARRFGLSAGAVSQRLAVLRAAGLASKHRDGKRVLHAQTNMAEVLLGGLPRQPAAGRAG